MKTIGDTRTFAFMTSPFEDRHAGKYLTIDIVIADRVVTVRDNVVYVPQFLHSMECTYDHLRKNLDWLQVKNELAGMNLTEAHLHLARTEGSKQFLNWGPTTDDISCTLIVFQGSLWINYYLRSENKNDDGREPLVNGVCVSPFELMETLRLQIEMLKMAG